MVHGRFKLESGVFVSVVAFLTVLTFRLCEITGMVMSIGFNGYVNPCTYRVRNQNSDRGWRKVHMECVMF